MFFSQCGAFLKSLHWLTNQPRKVIEMENEFVNGVLQLGSFIFNQGLVMKARRQFYKVNEVLKTTKLALNTLTVH